VKHLVRRRTTPVWPSRCSCSKPTTSCCSDHPDRQAAPRDRAWHQRPPKPGTRCCSTPPRTACPPGPSPPRRAAGTGAEEGPPLPADHHRRGRVDPVRHRRGQPDLPARGLPRRAGLGHGHLEPAVRKLGEVLGDGERWRRVVTEDTKGLAKMPGVQASGEGPAAGASRRERRTAPGGCQRPGRVVPSLGQHGGFPGTEVVRGSVICLASMAPVFTLAVAAFVFACVTSSTPPSATEPNPFPHKESW
jgi:hypothetical protein